MLFNVKFCNIFKKDFINRRNCLRKLNEFRFNISERNGDKKEIYWTARSTRNCQDLAKIIVTFIKVDEY